MMSAVMMSPVTMALMTSAMMVAMMLPSFAPALWRYHRSLRRIRMPRAAERTALFVAGYATVWIAIGLVLFAITTELSRMGMAPPFAPSAAGAVVLSVGLLQCSRWKAKQLRRCRHGGVRARAASTHFLEAWRQGCGLGVDCGLSCMAPMAILFVSGLMNPVMMVVITAAISAERIGAAGARIARMSGAVAIAAGLIICIR